MAMPQLAIDAGAAPMLQVFVNHADRCAQALAPLVESRQVMIQSYRRLRWGEKKGLLLDAA
jgi:hypothetical protein